jgi:hypothetical protein
VHPLAIAIVLIALVQAASLAVSMILYIRLKKREADDPRLSRHFQLIQSKIAVLEDFSENIDKQSRNILSQMDARIKEVNQKIQEAAETISKIEASRQKSMEVATLFEDKIPHDEVIEKQLSLKYIQASKMAYEGHSISEIAHAVQLPIAEVEMIVKMNPAEKNKPEDQSLHAIGEKFRSFEMQKQEI